MPPEEQAHSFDEDVLQVVSSKTVAAWNQVISVLPPGTYLAGGTALAVHLRHRESRDLDFFTSHPVDMFELADTLYRIGYAPEYEDMTQIKGHLGLIRVDVTDASAVRMLRPFERLEDGSIAALEDLHAMKLFAITHRLEQRDFFDLHAIEAIAGMPLEEGAALFLEKYAPSIPEQAVSALLRRLALFGTAIDDPLLPSSRAELVGFFERRIPELLGAMGSRPSPWG